MSIKKRRWGKDKDKEAWLVCVMVQKKKHRAQFPTKREAVAYEEEVKRRIAAGTFRAEGTRLTVSALTADYEQFLRDRKEVKGKMRSSWLEQRLGHFHNYILADRTFMRQRRAPIRFEHGLANAKLGDLTTYEVEKFQDNLLRSGLSPKTTIEVMGTLSLFFEFAKKQGYVGINNVKALDKDARPVRERKEVIPPTPALVRAIIAIAGHKEALEIKFAALTGLRASEQWAVRWKHIDFASKKVFVRTRVQDGTEGKTKTKSSVRTVPLSQELIDDLCAWRAVSRYQGDGDLVFHAIKGGYVWHDDYRDSVFYPLFERAMQQWPTGLERPSRPRWHDLRHFAASSWIKAGLNIKAIQKYLGHANIQTTIDTYGHLFPDQDDSPMMDHVATSILGAGKLAGAILAHDPPQEARSG